jgi:hypothetical protein
VGHIRLGTLPKSRKWEQVVALLESGAGVAAIAAASANAAERDLRSAADDPLLLHTVWLLTQLPLAAREPDFSGHLRTLGLRVSKHPDLLEVLGALSEAVERRGHELRTKTDVGEMANLAASESFAALVGAALPGLFESRPEDVRQAFSRLGTSRNFSDLARDFFSRFTRRRLEYYLSRELSNHVGASARFGSIAEHAAFSTHLDQHCREASRIIKEFAGDWFGKTVWMGELTAEKVRGFTHVALKKIEAELRARRDTDA